MRARPCWVIAGWSPMVAVWLQTHPVRIRTVFGWVCDTTAMHLAWQEHGPHTFKMTAALAAIVPDQPPFSLDCVAAERPRLAEQGEEGGSRP